jgi:DNA polymerase III subunit gamma/tau
MSNNEEFELHKKYRPSSLDDVYGQDAIKKILSSKIENNKIPHAILLHGTKGTGKTTLARILANIIESDVSKEELEAFVLNEMDVARYNGVDAIRAKMDSLKYKSITSNGTGKKILILDEVHRASKAFYDAMLKQLEEPKDHVYWILCSTEYNKIPGTIADRCMQFNLRPLSYKQSYDFAKSILKKEDLVFEDKEIVDLIVEKSNGIPRLILRYIEACSDLTNADDVKLALETVDEEPETKDLIKLLIGPSKSWKQASKLLKSLHKKNNNPESLRIQIATYLNACMLNSKDNDVANNFANMLELFMDPLEYSVTAFTKLCHAVCLIMINK